MRVTQNSLYAASLENVNQKRSKMVDLQAELSSQKRINKPSDDPVGSAQVLGLRKNDANIEQFKQTGDQAEMLLNYSDTALDELLGIVNHLKELSISQSSDTSANESTRIAIGDEVEQIYSQLTSVGNRKMGDKFIFGGYHTTSEPFDSFGTYKGDLGQINVEVNDGVFMPVNLNGAKIFLGKQISKGKDGVNLFDVTRTLHTGLMTNDTKLIQTTLDDLDKATQQVIQLRAELGSRINTIKTYKNGLDQTKIDNAKLKSEIEDADIVSTASELKKEEALLDTTLNATKRLLQPSLLDYLK